MSRARIQAARGESTPSARGFTVVETLAVIGAIAVLLAITVPAMSSVRASARAGKCQSNLRQLGVAATSYALQNRDRYPAAILYELTSAGLVTKAWDFEQLADGTVRPGAIWEFASGPAEVQQCPEFEGASTFGGDPYTGYNYNTTYIGAEGRFPELDALSRVLTANLVAHTGGWPRRLTGEWVLGAASEDLSVFLAGLLAKQLGDASCAARALAEGSAAWHAEDARRGWAIDMLVRPRFLLILLLSLHLEIDVEILKHVDIDCKFLYFINGF